MSVARHYGDMAQPNRTPLADRGVDTRENRSLSLGPSTGTRIELGAREPVPVGPGRPASSPSLALPIGGDVLHEFPLQPAKVQRPPLRRETLRRERLIAWLKVKIHHRIVLVTAEAGYGKTTLLADFARHHRRPTMWYRLDEDDRNWVSFLHYLVAAGREIKPDFAPATKGLLTELGVGTGPSRDTVIATFMRELQSLGPKGATLIIDDYHLVDDVPDIRVLIKQLISRAPERLTLVFVSRLSPTVPLARLRTLGEVAELDAADLRFDLDETERLFRETYKRTLEPDVLSDLADRTEGWAASLEMVNAALRDRSPGEIRTFVRGLSGAQGELYDYLAEEVVGDLDDETQRFLMTTSLLQTVDPALAEVVGGFPATRARELIAATERYGLLSTRGTSRRGVRRYHPLVREFLESRLRRTLGDAVARDLHRAVARHAGASDWRLAAYHFAAADDMADLATVVQAAVPTIMGTGEFALAESYVLRVGAQNNAAFELFVSRMDLYRGRTDSARKHAELAVEKAMSWNQATIADHALLNLITVLHVGGDLETEHEVAELLATRTTSSIVRAIARAVVAILDGSTTANLDEVRTMLLEMAAEQEASGLRHYVGITWLNVADIDCARGDTASALSASTRAIQELSATSSGIEVEAAMALRGWALAQQGEWQEAREEFQRAESKDFDAVRGETLAFIAEAYAAFGDRFLGEGSLLRASEAPFNSDSTVDLQHLVSAMFALRRGDLDGARMSLDAIATDRPHAVAAFMSRFLLTRAWLAVAAKSAGADKDVSDALNLAVRQGARLYACSARVLQAATHDQPAFNEAVRHVVADRPASLSLIAELVTDRLPLLDPAVLASVASEAARMPDRWREGLRQAIHRDDRRLRLEAAVILDRVGEHQDVLPLRLIAKEHRRSHGAAGLGRGLARRLAARIVVEDQGRVAIQVGDRDILGSTGVRRMALALFCFLLSRPNLSATRDQVLDALWPEQAPKIAVNSLNQTAYHLRRVFEPSYSADTSPHYLHHDSDVLWLDPELVDSRSARSRAAIRQAEADPSPENVERLSETYRGRFALDFEYEDWAGQFRDSMHASYLEIIERAVSADTNTGAVDRAIRLARRALEADPKAEQMQLSLVRLYVRTDAQSAAAELYGHYAAAFRNDLGIEPPSLESLVTIGKVPY
ncbi:MAG: BTAD domain-containing putative transcriptional regulator [Chloroflexota bacterium]